MNQNPYLPSSATYGIGSKCFRITGDYVTERPFVLVADQRQTLNKIA
jgi:hypothetical protein